MDYNLVQFQLRITLLAAVKSFSLPKYVTVQPNNKETPSEGKSSLSGHSGSRKQEEAAGSIIIDVPQISLPKGGGAIKVINETLSVNPVNGTASFSIPLPFSLARDASPILSLSYNSCSDNGIFGMGGSLGLSTIKRKTENELIQYLDAIDSDTYLFSGAEDLVPEFEKYYAGIIKKDKKGGKIWVTKLHFPVHFLVKDIVNDRWQKSEFTNRYSYHHGYYDHAEREFRGFGRVKKVDTEPFGEFTKRNASCEKITADQILYQPPVKTTKWYHTGAFLNRENILSQFREEYFPNWLEAIRPNVVNILVSLKENKLPEPDLGISKCTKEEWREALFLCKGMMLRQELYELDVDGMAKEEKLPVKLYTTAYHNCHIIVSQPKEKNRYTVFHVTENEAIIYHYEMNPRLDKLETDRRIAHTLNINIDDYGNVLQSVVVVYPRYMKQALGNLISPKEITLINDVHIERHLDYTETFHTDDVNE